MNAAIRCNMMGTLRYNSKNVAIRCSVMGTIRYNLMMQHREVQHGDKVQQYDVCSMVMRSNMMIECNTMGCSTMRSSMVMESPWIGGSNMPSTQLRSTTSYAIFLENISALI